jgi:HD-like signal output (HDOD) protein
MIDWLMRWFGTPDEKTSATGTSAAARFSAAAPVMTMQAKDDWADWQPQIDIDKMFFRCLTGNGNDAGQSMPQVEKAILDALDKLIHSEKGGAELIPRVPSVMTQVLQSLRNENISGTELSAEIAHDVVLVGEVIRQANSSFYQPREPVTSLENAVMVLGKNGLRMLIAKTAFRPLINIQAGRHAKRAAPLLWDQSEKCAQACRMLAAQKQADPFTAFLAGLMQNIGLIIAFRLIDQVYDGRTLPSSDAFCWKLNSGARSLSHQVAQLWNMPDTVINVLAELKGANAVQELPEAADVVFTSDHLSKLRMLIDQHAIAEGDERIATGMPHALKQCLQGLHTGTES